MGFKCKNLSETSLTLGEVLVLSLHLRALQRYPKRNPSAYGREQSYVREIMSVILHVSHIGGMF